MKEALEKYARDLIKLALTTGIDDKARARAAVLLLDTMAQNIEREFLHYGE